MATTVLDKINAGKQHAQKQTTPVLVVTLAQLDIQFADAATKAKHTGDYGTVQALNMVRSWTIEALELRYPAASQAVEAAFDNAADDEEVDYVAVLLAAIPAGEK